MLLPESQAQQRSVFRRSSNLTLLSGLEQELPVKLSSVSRLKWLPTPAM